MGYELANVPFQDLQDLQDLVYSVFKKYLLENIGNNSEPSQFSLEFPKVDIKFLTSLFSELKISKEEDIIKFFIILQIFINTSNNSQDRRQLFTFLNQKQEINNLNPYHKDPVAVALTALAIFKQLEKNDYLLFPVVVVPEYIENHQIVSLNGCAFFIYSESKNVYYCLVMGFILKISINNSGEFLFNDGLIRNILQDGFLPISNILEDESAMIKFKDIFVAFKHYINTFNKMYCENNEEVNTPRISIS